MRGLAFALLLLANLAQARPVQAEPLGGECFSHAAQTYGVNAKVLMAIAWHESHFLPWRVHRNSDGSTDYGVMQVNSRNLPALGLTTQTVMQPCTHILAAARLYGRAVRRYGNTWAAVGVYHSTTPALQQRYAQDIQQNFNVITRINAWWGKLCAGLLAYPRGGWDARFRRQSSARNPAKTRFANHVGDFRRSAQALLLTQITTRLLKSYRSGLS